MKRCKSTARAVPAHSSLTSSDLAYDEAVSRGVLCLAAAGASAGPSRLRPLPSRSLSSQPPIQAGPSDATHLLGTRRLGISGARRQGRGRGDLVLDRIARRLRQPADAVVTLPNKRLKLAGGDRLNGSGVLCPGGHGLTFSSLAPAGESPAAQARSVRRRESSLRLPGEAKQ